MKETMQKKYQMNLCEGPVLGKMISFSLPIILSGLLQLAFNAADMIVVGKFAGDNSLAAVGSTGSLINLITNLFMGLAVGAGVVVARYYGAKSSDQLKKTIHTSILISIISGIILTIFGVLFTRQILIWMESKDDVLDLSSLYLRIYFLGMTPMMVYNFGSSILRSLGDTKRPLYYLTFAGVVNVILNLIFVIVFSMDVAGVALATAISQTIAAVLIIRCMMREEGDLKLTLKDLRIDKSKAVQIIKIGLPAGFQGILFSFTNVLIQKSINSFGEIVMAGSAASGSLEGFVYVAMNAMYQAAISFAGQNMGAGKYERIPKIFKTALLCVMVLGLVLGNGFYLFCPWLLSFFTDNPEVIKEGITRFAFIGPTYALCGMMDVCVGIMRGIGYSITPMIVSLVGVCGLRLVWLLTLFQMPRFHTIEMVYVTYPISWILTLLAHIGCFLVVWNRIKKKKNEIIK